MLPLSSRICQCIRQFFVKRPTFLAATANLRVEQNLVHLGRFLHFSQKVDGVTFRDNTQLDRKFEYIMYDLGRFCNS